MKSAVRGAAALAAPSIAANSALSVWPWSCTRTPRWVRDFISRGMSFCSTACSCSSLGAGSGPRPSALALGPNALTLPCGDIVLADATVALLADSPDVLTGVLTTRPAGAERNGLFHVGN